MAATTLLIGDANPQLGLITLVEIGARVGGTEAFIPCVSGVKRSRLYGTDPLLPGFSSPDAAFFELT